jgi:Protein of unknown function (DUF2793)
MTATANLALPLLAAGQAQKHVTHNDALLMIDSLLHLSVLSRAPTTPPAAPAEGDRYLVPASATGGWAGKSGQIAAWVDGGWLFYPPRAGWTVWIAAENTSLVYDGTAFESAQKLDLIDRIGINATADSINRLTVKSPASLFDNQGGGHQIKLNKANAAATGSVLFQTGYSGRAELGLAGDDNFRINASADGTTWRTALEIDKATGNIAAGGPPNAADRLRLRQDQNATTQITVENADAGTNAASSCTLLATNGNYFRFHLYGSGTMYAYTAAQFVIGTYANTSLYLRTNTLDRVVINGDGRVSVGSYTHSAKLYVDGAMRPKGYLVAALPSASVEGAGAMIFVSNESAGPTVAFSDGTNWRRVHDRAVVS